MIKGIIFDMDGVISDTQKLHAGVESEILKRYNINLTPEEITRRYAGVRTRDFLRELLDVFIKNENLDINEVINEKWSRMLEMAKINVDEIPGAVDLIKSLKKQNFSLALASASTHEFIDIVLRKLDIKDYFDAVVSSDDVENGKPAPDIFLLSASRIKINPNECIVIEDGISGMQAAQNAGMRCIGLVEDLNKKYPTIELVTSLKNIKINN